MLLKLNNLETIKTTLWYNFQSSESTKIFLSHEIQWFCLDSLVNDGRGKAVSFLTKDPSEWSTDIVYI